MSKENKHPNLAVLNAEMMKDFAIDYIVNEVPMNQLCQKYNITYHTYYQLCDFLKVKQKREEYRRKLLDKALAKLADKQSTILVKSVQILMRQLEHIEKVQNFMAELPEDENKRLESKLAKLLPSELVNDVMKIFMLMVKENRLNNGQATDTVVTKVIVEMAPSNNSAGAVFQKPTIDVTPQQAPQKAVESKDEKTEVKVEIEGAVLGLPT